MFVDIDMLRCSSVRGPYAMVRRNGQLKVFGMGMPSGKYAVEIDPVTDQIRFKSKVRGKRTMANGAISLPLDLTRRMATAAGAERLYYTLHRSSDGWWYTTSAPLTAPPR